MPANGRSADEVQRDSFQRLRDAVPYHPTCFKQCRKSSNVTTDSRKQMRTVVKERSKKHHTARNRIEARLLPQLLRRQTSR